jgi:hypothetical protein
MFTALVVAAAMGMAAEPKTLPAKDGMFQATKLICRHKPGAKPSGPPFCRSSGHLTPLQCGCASPDLEFRDPACFTNGKPALFPVGHQVSNRDMERMVSCVEWERRHKKKDKPAPASEP